MTPEERQMLEGLFDRVKQSSAAPRDREAEDMIHQAVQAQPHAPYLLAQAVIVQEEGLKAAAARIQELEAELDAARAQAQRPAAGGFLGGLFGGGSPAPAAPARSGSGVPSFGGQRAPFQPSAQPSGPWGGQPGAPGGRPGPFGGGGGAPAAGGGSFLRGAMATAAGVAGGALLFSGIQSLMAGGITDPVSAVGDQASAAADAAMQPASAPAEDPSAGYEEAAYDDPGADDFGDDGDWA
jgi:hypothetical protein